MVHVILAYNYPADSTHKQEPPDINKEDPLTLKYDNYIENLKKYS